MFCENDDVLPHHQLHKSTSTLWVLLFNVSCKSYCWWFLNKISAQCQSWIDASRDFGFGLGFFSFSFPDFSNERILQINCFLHFSVVFCIYACICFLYLFYSYILYLYSVFVCCVCKWKLHELLSSSAAWLLVIMYKCLPLIVCE